MEIKNIFPKGCESNMVAWSCRLLIINSIPQKYKAHVTLCPVVFTVGLSHSSLEPYEPHLTVYLQNLSKARIEHSLNSLGSIV